ncbi:MAG TPA: beta-propeller fold lactonase family protein [Candidatus Polarisedimenticolia bacterium]|nr:beta-propeller fold lactonase family protein [Candidatus Polarisedimenticolia bacterium]
MTRHAAVPIATLLASILTSGALPARGARPAIARAPAAAAVVCDPGEILGYLYVNEETTDRTAESADNVVSGFAAHADGCVEVLTGSPWPTGGLSASGLVLIAAPRLDIAARGDRLYALNRGSDDVAAFRVGAEGDLVPLDGSPFDTGGRGPQGMAVSPDGRWLFVAHRGDRRLTTLRLPPDGRPSLAASFDLDAEANGLVVSRDGRFLVAALSHLARVAVLEIAPDGSLRHAPGSPARADLNGADGVVLAPGGADVYVSAADLDRLAVSRYRLGEDGAIDRVAGSPYFGPGGAGNVLAMLPDGAHLLASQTVRNALTAFRVDASGGLTPTPVSPFPTGFGQQLPTGMAFDPLGQFLWVVHADGSGIASLRHLGNGSFAPAAAPTPSRVDGVPLNGLAFVPRQGSDADADGAPFPADNCGAAANPEQSDADGDGVGDACDDCPLVSDPGQRDADRDGAGDACDPDRDGDGVTDAADRCPDRPDPGQTDDDHDGVGDACDNCPAVPNEGQEDADRDREGDACARPFVLIGRLYVQAESPENAIAGYDVDTLGRLRRIAGSPFATGGNGPVVTTLFAPKRLEWSPLMPTLLFASNEGSDNLSVMRIDADGGLALATGRLRASGGSRPAGLAIRPHTLQLVVGHLGSANLTLYQIQPSSGAIFGIAGGTIPTQGRPSGMAFTPDGRFLEVALTDLGPARTLKIDPPYQFLPETGIGDRNGRAATPLFNRAGDRLYLASSTAGESIVSGWAYDDEGMPERLLRSPQTAGGLNSNILFMHPDRRHLYVSQQRSNTIGVLRIEPSGELAPLGGPFPPARFAAEPVGLAADASGRFLFASYAQSNTVAAYRVTPEFGVEALGEAEKTGAPAGRPLAGVVFVPAGDEDDDGRSALEDNCPGVANPGQADADGDGTGDVCDTCPLDAGDNGDSDGDGIGDACDEDQDGDGIGDAGDLCPLDADADQTDTDGDARGDRCDRCRLDPFDDADADGSCADFDNCPVVYNPFQENSDVDRHGNDCDNCPFLWNDDQADIDAAEGGDACQRGFQQTGFLFVDTDAIDNSLATWETKSTGRLMPTPGSPYFTAGNGHPNNPSRTSAPAIGFVERGRFLFVLNPQSRDISVFHLASDGLPRSIPGSPFPTGFEQPIGLVADPGARFVWVAAREPDGGRLRVFDVARSGRLAPGAGEVVALEALPDGLALSPDGRWLAVSIPEAGRVLLFGVPEGELAEAVSVPGGPPRWDGAIPGLPRPGPLSFALTPSGRLLLDVGSASPDRAVVAALDLASGMPAGPAFDLGVTGGVSALAGSSSPEPGSEGAMRLFATLPGANAVAVVEGLHGGGAAVQPSGSPFPLPAGAQDPVGLAVDPPWLHITARQSGNLATFRVEAGGALAVTPVPPTSVGASGGHPAAGVVRFVLDDRDDDGVGPLADNCPSAANPAQEDRDGDGAGDACQPEISLGPILAGPYLPPAGQAIPEAQTALAAALHLEEPQEEPLEGRVVIAARGGVSATLLDAAAGGALTPIDCRRALRPAAGIGGGIAYVYGSVGDAFLFDQDALLVCDDGRPDYELGEGRCGTPGQPFTTSLILSLRTPPFDVCARPIADRSVSFDLRLEAIEPDHLDLSAVIEQAIVDAPWDGRPDPIPLSSLGSAAGPFTLAITASDGDTPPVRARASFQRAGAEALIFGAAPLLPDLGDRRVECAASGGTPVDLDSVGARDPDGEALSFFWLEEDGAGEVRLLATGPAPRVSLPYGEHRLVLDIVDPTGLLARGSFVVTIGDTRPPEILLLAADPEILWPPDHRLVPVRLRLEARDACFEAAEARLLDVTSSEPDDAPGGGDGRTVGDIVPGSSGEGEWALVLRAERLRPGPGRTYRARFVVADAAGNERQATIEIAVPRSAPD